MQGSDQGTGDRKIAIRRAVALVLYAFVGIAMGPLWCLALSIPVSLAATIVRPNTHGIGTLIGVSALASAIAYPFLRNPLTPYRIFGWPIPFSLLMAIIFGWVVVFTVDWQVDAGEHSILAELVVAVFYGTIYGTIYAAGSIHVAYPMAMAHLWALNRIRSRKTDRRSTEPARV